MLFPCAIFECFVFVFFPLEFFLPLAIIKHNRHCSTAIYFILALDAWCSQHSQLLSFLRIVVVMCIELSGETVQHYCHMHLHLLLRSKSMVLASARTTHNFIDCCKLEYKFRFLFCRYAPNWKRFLFHSRRSRTMHFDLVWTQRLVRPRVSWHRKSQTNCCLVSWCTWRNATPLLAAIEPK